ncbi:MAG TPA: response regulator [Acidimicrobiales bacterium]|nr:response regulator [Acidimicrobiales bacterium]
MSEQHSSSESDHPNLAAGQAGRVLVVDDQPSVRSSMADILRSQGFTVIEAADGAAALWLIADGELDVVLLDLRLCHVDGTAVLEALEPTAMVVIVSAFELHDETALRAEYGPKIFACLHKPVAPERLIEVVKAAATARHCVRVRPIESRDALRLGLAGLARLGPPRR